MTIVQQSSATAAGTASPRHPAPAQRVWRNAHLATMTGVDAATGAHTLGIVEKGAIAAENGVIAYAGPEADLPLHWLSSAEVIDCGGHWITPGLIDCHTHLVYAGDRAQEFALRLNGATYEEIARAGGGIVSSVKGVRGATEDSLTRQSLRRLDALMAEGVTTVEIKSGYGLDLANERKTLRVARRLGEDRPVTVRTTLLSAHALPPEWKDNQPGFVKTIVEDILPAIAAEGLADAVDGFCEGIAFSVAEMTEVFTAAQKLGLPVKLHADQLSNLGGAALAAEFQALSADHLEHTDEEGVMAMARAGTTAVILPGAYYFLRDTTPPPIALFRQHGVPMAVSTDNNPGTSPLTSLLLTMNMAATLFRMTVDECLLGVTRHAAKALGLEAETGTLEPGKWADLAIWDIEHPAELVYRMGFNPLTSRIWRGQ